MATRQDLGAWVEGALKRLGGSGTIPEVCREIWRKHARALEQSGDLFYTWQYDVRWAAHRLRVAGVLKADTESARGVWELKRRGQ